MHGRHGLADSVQGHVHLLLHPVTVGQELDHLHHHLEHGQKQHGLHQVPPHLDPTALSLPRRGPDPSKQAAVAKVAKSRLRGGLLKHSQAQGLTSNSPLVYLASGTLTISSSLISGMPWGGQRGPCH